MVTTKIHFAIIVESFVLTNFSTYPSQDGCPPHWSNSAFPSVLLSCRNKAEEAKAFIDVSWLS